MDKISQQLLFGKAAALPEDWAKFAVDANYVALIPEYSAQNTSYLLRNNIIYKLDSTGNVLSTITSSTWSLTLSSFMNSFGDVYFVNSSSVIFKFNGTLSTFNAISLSNVNLFGNLQLSEDNISVLNDTNVYALGNEYNSSTGASNVVATRFNLSTGVLSYTRRFSLSDPVNDYIAGIAGTTDSPVDSAGSYFTSFNIYDYDTSTGQVRSKAQVYKLSSTGTVSASRDLLITAAGSSLYIDSFTLDSSGNFYGVGWATEDFSNYRTVLVKLSNSALSTLNVLTIYNSITGISSTYDIVENSVHSVAIDYVSGKLYLTSFCKDSLNRYGVQLTILNSDLTVNAGYMLKIRTIVGSRFTTSEYLSLRITNYDFSRYSRIKIASSNLIINVSSLVPTGGDYSPWEFNIKLSTDNISLGEHQIGDFMLVIESISAQIGALGLAYTFTTVSGVSNASVSSAYTVNNTDITADVTVSGPSVPNVYSGFIS